jgi:lycopene beta-cyclase
MRDVMAAAGPLVIVGGGLAGSLAALALAERRRDVPIVLLESDSSFGGNHTWSYFDIDVPPAMAALVAALHPVRWPHHIVRFPARERTLPFAYNAVGAPALDALVRDRLPPGSWRLGAAVARIEPDGVVLQSGERIAASGVIDARGPGGAMPGLELGWQKFVGIEFAATSPTPDCATVMDATVPQLDGYRFVYVLPLAGDRVLVEDTYYSNDAALDVDEVAGRVRELAAQRGLAGAELRQEIGVLPILIGGDPDIFWPGNDPVARLGLRGGFFHAMTGYSIGMALRLADALAERDGPFDSASLACWTRSQFRCHWEASGYFRLLGRMLFHAAVPDERHRIFAHFYRLPPALIQRFYAGRLTGTDKLRIVSGRPPVPLGAALGAILGRRKGEKP